LEGVTLIQVAMRLGFGEALGGAVAGGISFEVGVCVQVFLEGGGIELLGGRGWRDCHCGRGCREISGRARRREKGEEEEKGENEDEE